MMISGRCSAILAGMAVLFCLYAALFIAHTSFVIGGNRYYSLFDDAMVSMRYAENLAQGHGLSWNADGEPVEGYTNFLWVIYMSLFHLLPIAKSKISLFVQISGALFLLANLIFVKKVSEQIIGGNPFYSLSAVLLTAFYLPLNNWSLQGMEVGLLVLIVSASIWLALKGLESGDFSVWPYALLGVGILVRPDMALIYLIVWLGLILGNRTQRSKNVLVGLAIFFLLLLGQTAFRFWYYHDALPNTYYLKMTGYPLLLRMARGALVTWQFVSRMNVALFLLPFAILFFRRDKFVLMLLAAFWGQMAYSIYVGGDAWEYWGGSNRYVSIVMPLFFILFCASLAETEVWLAKRGNRRHPVNIVWIRSLCVIIIMLGLVKFNLICSPNPTLQEWLLRKPALAVRDNRKMVEEALLLKEITDPQATVAVVWAGAIPYFSERPAIDMLGKNDRFIAHLPAKIPPAEEKYTAFYPGHMKWDYSHSISALKPDVIAQLYGVTAEEIDSFLMYDYWKVLIDGYVLHMRMDSPHLHWDLVNSRGQKWRHEKSLIKNHRNNQGN